MAGVLASNMCTDICVLCFEALLRTTDRNLIDGKSKVNVELDDLPFVVHHSSPYICKQCLTVIKKRKSLKAKLLETDERLTSLYRQKCGEYGFTVKRKQPSSAATRKLKFPDNDNNEGGEIQQDLEERHNISLSPFMPDKFLRTSTPLNKVPKKSSTNEEIMFHVSPINNKVDNTKEKRMPSECPVTISIEWTDRIKKKVLPQELSALGKMLCRGTKKQIARAAWQCDKIRPHLYAEIVKQIHKECVVMCVKGTNKENKKRKDSCLRRTDKESIVNFSFDNLINELEERAPLLLLVLKTAALRVKDDEGKWKPSVGVAAAVCLRNRSRNMIAVQLMIAIIDRHSGFMAGMNRLQSLRLMPSHTYFYKKLSEYGKDHDKKILDTKWMAHKQSDLTIIL